MARINIAKVDGGLLVSDENGRVWFQEEKTKPVQPKTKLGKTKQEEAETEPEPDSEKD